MSSNIENDGRTAGVSAIAWILLLACLLRTAAVVVRFENLQIARDDYLEIAQHLLDGHGYCCSVGQPTAFRPPLYPLLVAACLICGGFVAIGIVQILLGTATVWLTWRLGHQCRLTPRICLLAAMLIAVDPLLIEYSTQAMTETLFTFLVALLLVTTLRSDQGVKKGILIGVVFGLSALCRPSMWAFGGLAGAGWSVVMVLNRPLHSETISIGRQLRFKTALACVVATSVTVSPWVIRNTLQFGHPILMTTHGGYTLFLGNNETFFREVVSAQPGTVWDGSSLQAWQAENEQKISGMGIAETDERSRDAAFSMLAQQWIVANPYSFLRSCLYRKRSIRSSFRLWEPII